MFIQNFNKNLILLGIIIGTFVASFVWLSKTVPFLSPLSGDVVVISNPSGNNPLSASLYFETRQPTAVRVRVKDKYSTKDDLLFFSERALSHTVDVWGLYQNHNNEISIEFYQDLVLVDTENIDIYIPKVYPDRFVQSEVGDAEVLDGNFVLIGSEMYDKSGQLRWKLDVHNRQDVFPLDGGLFAVLASVKDLPAPEYQWVNIYDLAGYYIRQYKVPNGAHHEVIEKEPGGNLLIASHSIEGGDGQDMVVEVDRRTGYVIKQWDYRDILDESRMRWQQRSEEDWAHINSIFYDSADDSLLVSSKLQNTVIKIDYTTGKTKWILAPHTGWGSAHVPYLLTPTNFTTEQSHNQDWTYLQHHATVMDNGDILVYDNGAGRPGFTDTPDDHDKVVAGGYVRVVRYSIDEQNMTVTKIGEWSDFPEKGSNNRGSAFIFNDNKLMIGYAEFLTFVVRGGTDWSDALLKWNFQSNTVLADRTFYRVVPYDLSEFLVSGIE